MSNIYNLEPPTKGKVVLHTTLGDLDIELWPKEAPKAVRNFVQLCLEGYYDNTIFHRVIKDYLIQGGDPTGSGTGGESIYGGLFKDEFHSRIRFNHRGLVACANQNEPNTNGSQFFITLDKTDWLDKKNTIFGKITGDTIFNLARMNEIDTDPETDRPFEPPMIKEAEVLWNPFEDIVPRTDLRAKRREEEARKAEEAAKKKGRPAAAPGVGGKGKNLALLSFGDDAEIQEEEGGGAALALPKKIRAAHDVLQDSKLVRGEDTPIEERITIEPADRPAKKARAGSEGAEEEEEDEGAAGARAAQLSRTKAVLAAKAAQASGRPQVKKEEGGSEVEDEGRPGTSGVDFAAQMRAQMQDKRKRMGDVPEGKEDGGRGRSRHEGSDSEGERRERERERQREGERGGKGAGTSSKAIQEARREELEGIKRDKGMSGKMQTQGMEVADADLLKPWQVQREMYKQRKRATGAREKDTLARLQQFQAKLRTAGGEGGPSAGARAGSEGPSGDGSQQQQQQRQGSEGPGEAAGAEQGAGGRGYAGKVDESLDHRTYMPAAWRVDDYLEGDFLDTSLDELREHQLSFAKAPGRTDNMARKDDVDDYVVYDPLLEAKKGKFSKAAQKEKKRASEWAGRSNV